MWVTPERWPAGARPPAPTLPRPPSRWTRDREIRVSTVCVCVGGGGELVHKTECMGCELGDKRL